MIQQIIEQVIERTQHFTAWFHGAAFHTNKHILCNRTYSLKERLRVFAAVVTPTAMYGAGSWTLNQATEATLRRTQRQMLRPILQERRRPQEGDQNKSSHSSASDSTSNLDTASLQPEEHLEPWQDWIQRATRNIEHFSRKWGIEAC